MSFGFEISDAIRVSDDELGWRAIRAQGAGGQHVNKTSTAVELRFDVRASSLPEWLKTRLLSGSDRRINAAGEVVIKAQQARSQLANRKAAAERLRAMLEQAAITQRKRIATRPSHGAVRRRLDNKRQRSTSKRLRRKPGIGGDD
ncbi:MAG: alternative ribosome rescue aminoacyl-tRNA hydrolase ArfB [Pseudomonadota bacterium]